MSGVARYNTGLDTLTAPFATILPTCVAVYFERIEAGFLRRG